MKKVYTLASLLLALLFASVLVQAAGAKASNQQGSLRQAVSATAQSANPTKFLTACQKGDIKSVLRYLEKNQGKKDFDINMRDKDGNTPLILASASGHKDVVNALLQVPGIKIDARRLGTGMTALMYAAAWGHKHVVHVLVKAGAKISIKDYEGRTAVMLAASSGQVDIIRELGSTVYTNRGEQAWRKLVDMQDEKGKTALMYACLSGRNTRDYAEPVVALLDYVANPNIQDNEGKTALIHATIDGDIGAVGALLTQGLMYKADPNIQDNKGKTALMYAAIHGQGKIVSVLLDMGKADATIKDNEGLVAQDYTADDLIEQMLRLAASKKR